MPNFCSSDKVESTVMIPKPSKVFPSEIAKKSEERAECWKKDDCFIIKSGRIILQ